MKKDRYARPNPVIHGQTKPENKALLEAMAQTHGQTISKLIDEALEIAKPKLLKRYPVGAQA